MSAVWSRRALIRSLGLATLALFLSACSRPQQPWHLNNVTGLLPPLSFTLTDDNGQQVTAQHYAGKVVLLFFGFTHCDDECPYAMHKLAGILKNLGKEADDTQVLFVSVDPQRDTPPVLKAYAAALDPHVVGLRPSPAELETLAKRYRFSYTPPAANTAGDYQVAHSDAVFIFDRTGAARLLATPVDTAAAIQADVQRLIASD